MARIKKTSEITVINGYVSFECTSESYGKTEAAGKAVDVLKNGFISLGDGNDYRLTKKDKDIIRAKLISDSYYARELNTLNVTEQITFQFRDFNGGKTKFMNLNKESIEALEVFLNAYKLLLK